MSQLGKRKRTERSASPPKEPPKKKKRVTKKIDIPPTPTKKRPRPKDFDTDAVPNNPKTQRTSYSQTTSKEYVSDPLKKMTFNAYKLPEATLNNFKLMYPKASKWDPSGMIGDFHFYIGPKDNVTEFYDWEYRRDPLEPEDKPIVHDFRLIDFKNSTYFKDGTQDKVIHYENKTTKLVQLEDFPIIRRLRQLATSMIPRNKHHEDNVETYINGWYDTIWHALVDEDPETYAGPELHGDIVFHGEGVDVNFLPDINYLVNSTEKRKNKRSVFLVTMATNKNKEEFEKLVDGQFKAQIYPGESPYTTFRDVAKNIVGMQFYGESVRFLKGQSSEKESVPYLSDVVNKYQVIDIGVETNDYGNVHFHAALEVCAMLPDEVYANLRIDVMRQYLTQEFGPLFGYLNVTHVKNFTGHVSDYIHKGAAEFVNINQDYV